MEKKNSLSSSYIYIICTFIDKRDVSKSHGAIVGFGGGTQRADSLFTV